MISLDRFEQGLPDIQDMPVVDYCKWCGEPMYYHVDNRTCEDCEAMNNEEE